MDAADRADDVVGRLVVLEDPAQLGGLLAQPLAVLAQLVAILAGRPVDVVVSDMAPNLSGVEVTDSARIAHLVELAVEFATAHLRPQGALVCKVFHGSGYSQLVKMFKEQFRTVKPLKPKASRDKSSETFLVGIGLKSVR